jgi:hypothetical protein
VLLTGAHPTSLLPSLKPLTPLTSSEAQVVAITERAETPVVTVKARSDRTDAETEANRRRAPPPVVPDTARREQEVVPIAEEEAVIAITEAEAVVTAEAGALTAADTKPSTSAEAGAPTAHHRTVGVHPGATHSCAFEPAAPSHATAAPFTTTSTFRQSGLR